MREDPEHKVKSLIVFEIVDAFFQNKKSFL